MIISLIQPIQFLDSTYYERIILLSLMFTMSQFAKPVWKISSRIWFSSPMT